MIYNPKYGPGAPFSVDPNTLHGKRAIENAAILCYEANRAYARVDGDDSFKPWSKAEPWQLETNAAGVRSLIEDPTMTPEISHNLWRAHKEKEGWVYGETKDAEKKTHPCMLPYGELPPFQRRKDVLFQATARAALDVYGMRFTHHAGEQKEFTDRSPWRCHRPLFEFGMYVITGRMYIIVEAALHALAMSFGTRVAESGGHRNQVLSQQLSCAMMTKDPTDAYGMFCAQQWPEEMPPLMSEKRLVHWQVLFALAHAVMDLEGVHVQRRVGTKWVYGNEEIQVELFSRYSHAAVVVGTAAAEVPTIPPSVSGANYPHGDDPDLTDDDA